MPIDSNVRKWERQFDKRFNDPAVKRAWAKLLEYGCDASALKSTLFHAASAVENSEYSRKSEVFLRAKEQALLQIPALSRALQQLMAPRLLGRSFARAQLSLWPLRKQQIKLFEDFPVLLEKFEQILKTIALPAPEKRHIEVAHTIARGEAPIHIYVKETTGKSFEEEIPVLLEAGSLAYGLEHGPSYTSDAVNRRYRRFRSRANGEYRLIRKHVRRNKRKGGFLHRYLNESLIVAALELGAFQWWMKPRVRHDPNELLLQLLQRMSKRSGE